MRIFQTIFSPFLLIGVFLLVGYPPTPQEFRGLWCIERWNETQQNYSHQIGQAFFYNNGTFTLNFLDNLTDTWVCSERMFLRALFLFRLIVSLVFINEVEKEPIILQWILHKVLNIQCRENFFYSISIRSYRICQSIILLLASCYCKWRYSLGSTIEWDMYIKSIRSRYIRCNNCVHT